MIDSTILRVIAASAPNYHTLSKRFVRGKFSVTPCKDCEKGKLVYLSSADGEVESKRPVLVCGCVYDALVKHKASGGLAVVSAYGTCDAVIRKPSNEPADLTLEQETITLPTTLPTDITIPTEVKEKDDAEPDAVPLEV